jgi:hypothetical protein
MNLAEIESKPILLQLLEEGSSMCLIKINQRSIPLKLPKGCAREEHTRRAKAETAPKQQWA